MAHKSIKVKALKVKQPIGEFFIASIDARKLVEVAKADIRRVEEGHEREHLSFIGIQRPLSDKRVSELRRYIEGLDATFPTSVILAVKAECAFWDDDSRELELKEFAGDDNREPVEFGDIAKILDGQHRVAGLKKYYEDMLSDAERVFDINITVFVDIDIAAQAMIFSTVNLAQTKVNKSLVYDLFDYAKAPSPQKTCHHIAVALDAAPKSPFHKRIKRLGVSTEGRFSETLTQATFVEALMPLISNDPIRDRNAFLEGKKPPVPSERTLSQVFFMKLFLEGKEEQIAKIIWVYFDSIRYRWPEAWSSSTRGVILGKTNGFRALMRFFKVLYPRLASPGEYVERSKYDAIFSGMDLRDEDFNIDKFPPGTAGESRLFATLKEQAGL